MSSIFVIVVSYNRKHLLIKCINRLLSQSLLPTQIFIIDNASTDGTESYLKAQGFLDHSLITYHCLTENIGGAGGFAEGIKMAMQSGAEWMWLMDDDAMPAYDALEKLLQSPLNESCVYGSVAIGEGGERLCWPVETAFGKKLISLDDLGSPQIPVVFHPFLGFLISRKLATEVGLPDAEFFLSGDDVDYCLRIASLGGKVYLCRASRLNHPMPPRTTINILGIRIDSLVQTPERTYYNIRNKIVIARRYYGTKLWTQTTPGILIRFTISILAGPNRYRYIKAYSLAIFHGLLGKLGKYSL
ncbi:MAG: glycosyltransferase family 2 protein [Methylicorpusculum sp.]|uniref:glycosyltransferase family 2 protein n=1 Tax=Methylicorpusculum sp. TaxID=2713644 RepID=UPI0027245DDE|nr:glycosyltransferase family 2 protein [Methylicorpusculum sp.]MDO8938377.1 glycosyltransferase family 2 protein [Methylicorpusculum sp.]MDP2202023.1 glycosyltransferase family 2 protein [Methylicorpusculum sp.]